MVEVCSVAKCATGNRETSTSLRAFGKMESRTMKNALTRWAFGAAFGLIVGAVGISITTEQAWAETCSGTTIGHRNADCLTVAYSNNRQTLSLTSECSGLGDVTAEVKIINLGTDGPIIYLWQLIDSTPFVSHLRSDDATFTNARCCSTSGICDITDCDTADGVINDSSNAAHCSHINDTTGVVNTQGNEITNGVVTYTPPSDGR